MNTPMASRLGAAAWGAALLAVLSGLAPSPVIVTDNFNNNAINNALWLQRQHGGVTLAETNQRLEFSANGATGDFSFASLEVEPWGAKWRYDFEVQARFRLNVNNANGERDVVLGIVLALTPHIPDTFTGYAAAIWREGNDLTLFLERYIDGEGVESDDVALGVIQGKLTLDYDRSSDRLRARVGNQSIHLDGAWSHFGAAHGNDPMVIALCCVTTDGNISFPGSRVYLDDFKFTGVKKPR